MNPPSPKWSMGEKVGQTLIFLAPVSFVPCFMDENKPQVLDTLCNLLLILWNFTFNRFSLYFQLLISAYVWKKNVQMKRMQPLSFCYCIVKGQNIDLFLRSQDVGLLLFSIMCQHWLNWWLAINLIKLKIFVPFSVSYILGLVMFHLSRQ